MLYFLPLRSCFSPVTCLKLKKKHGERGRFNMTSFDDICGHFGSVYLRVTLFSKCTHFLGIKVFETCTIKNTFLEISCQWWIPRLVWTPQGFRCGGGSRLSVRNGEAGRDDRLCHWFEGQGMECSRCAARGETNVTLGSVDWNFPILLMVQKSG